MNNPSGINRAIIIAHHQRAEAARLARIAADWFDAHGIERWMPSEDAEALELHDLAGDLPASAADVALCLGGDGTVLRAALLLDGSPAPLLGVNVGMLGYLAEVEPAAMEESLERVVRGEFRIEARMAISATLRRASGNDAGGEHDLGPWRALNEAVLEKEESGHTIRLDAAIDGAPFTSYAADGVIVATPTGSTAYSFSARGPVVSPTLRALLLTPVSPHMLFDRALVMGEDELVELVVVGHRPVALTLDGRRVASLAEGDTVRIAPAAEPVHFVRFGERRFHQILKAKFGLPDR